MNSRAKGARGERQWRDELRANGYDARRGQQYSGSPESPDVVCAALPWVHFEVKAVERLNIEAAMDQARRDGVGKVPFVAHKRNHRPWLVTMEADIFFELVREFQPKGDTDCTNANEAERGSGIQNEPRGQASPFPPNGGGKDAVLTPREHGGPEDYLGCGDGCGQ